MLYLAGNFPLLNDLKRERDFKDKILASGREYQRLVSFYYPKTVETVFTLKKEQKSGRKKEGENRDRK